MATMFMPAATGSARTPLGPTKKINTEKPKNGIKFIENLEDIFLQKLHDTTYKNKI